MQIAKRKQFRRTGGIYLAVLATALVVSLLSISALVGQRLQNRLVVASADIRQAQLNANSAIELALLTMKQDANWRTSYPNGNWYVKRAAGNGSCTVNVTDPIDANLANNPDDPIVVLGIGFSGEAEQRVQVTVDPRQAPLTCLRSAVAVGDTISLNGDILRSNNALITAQQMSASGAQVYGNVEAVTVSGSTYHGTTTQVLSEKRPTMPDWSSAFNYYRTNGTQISISSLPTSLPSMVSNPSFDDNDNDWTGIPPAALLVPYNLENATTQRQTNIAGHAACLYINRPSRRAGALQHVDSYLKPNTTYSIQTEIYFPGSFANNYFVIGIYVQMQDGTVLTAVKSSPQYLSNGLFPSWKSLSANLSTGSWSGHIRHAFILINSDGAGSSDNFYIDNVSIVEQTSGRFIFQRVISPSHNPFGATTNSEGIYWINCNGNKIVIERSRILGTLLIVNPGAGSCVADGPIHWSPAVPGFPALLVDADDPVNADFALNATNRALSEKENGVNFNPAGASHEDFGQDSDTNDIYRSMIRGLVAVRDDLTFQNRTLVRGQVVVGDDISDSSGELEVEFLPDSLLNPPPGFSAPYTYVRRAASLQKAVAN